MESQAKMQEALVRNNVELDQEEEEEDGEVEKLEAEVKEMAEKILSYRTTLPGQLKSTLSSILAAQRPILQTHFDFGSESQAGPSDDPNQDVVRPIGSGDVALVGEDQETEKIDLLKQKISSNASAMSAVLKKMKDCMTRIDKLDSDNRIVIHPAFKRKRTS